MAAKSEKRQQERKPPFMWRRILGVSLPEHSAVLVLRGWKAGDMCTMRQYKSALSRWKKGAA